MTSDRAQNARNIIKQTAPLPERVLDHAIQKLLIFTAGRKTGANALHVKKDYCHLWKKDEDMNTECTTQCKHSLNAIFS